MGERYSRRPEDPERSANHGGMSQREVAVALGLSRSRVWQIERKALRKLRRRFGDTLLRELLREGRRLGGVDG